MARFVFITGTDTGVGKTVLTGLLVRHLRRRGVDVVALKPLCSGGRDDARHLWAAQAGEVPMDVINPWSFRAPVTPLLAARAEGRRVARGALLAHLRAAGRGADRTIVEGAGGLLSPLLEDLDGRSLATALRARVVVVAPNRLGVLNSVLLTWQALPPTVRASAQLVLMDPARGDRATPGNAGLLGERLGPDRIHRLPRLAAGVLRPDPGIPVPTKVARVLDAVVARWE